MEYLCGIRLLIAEASDEVEVGVQLKRLSKDKGGVLERRTPNRTGCWFYTSDGTACLEAREAEWRPQCGQALNLSFLLKQLQGNPVPITIIASGCQI
jgi:hypothetical protein